MNTIVKYKKIFPGVFFMILLNFTLPVLVSGQVGEHNQEQKNERVQKKVRMQLDYFNINDQDYSIRATVKTKEGRSYVTVDGAVVRFSMTTDNGESEVDLGAVVSDMTGVAQLSGKVSDLPRFGTITITATIAESEDFKKYSRDLDIHNVRMAVDYVTEDSTNRIKVHCSIMNAEGQDVPVSDLEIDVFVERLFGELPISTEFNTTDDFGQANILFPDNVRGGADGQLVVLVRIIDHEEYGNLVNRKEISWGTHLIQNGQARERLMWAAKNNAPLPLVIIINSVLIAVWGMILYIVFNVVKIRRLGKTPNPL
jgi:hypothetical protein